MTYAKMLKLLKECKKDLDEFYPAYENNKIRRGYSKKIDYMLEIKEDKHATLYNVVGGQTPIISGNSYEALLFALTYQMYFERLSNLPLK